MSPSRNCWLPTLIVGLCLGGTVVFGQRAFQNETGQQSQANSQQAEPDSKQSDSPATDFAGSGGIRLTQAEIAKRAEQAKSATDLDEAVQLKIQQLYERAGQQLELASQAKQDLQKFEELASQAKTLISSTQRKLESFSEEPELPDLSEHNESGLQQLLRQKSNDLDQARDEVKRWGTEVARRQSRLIELPELISKTKSRLIEVEEQLRIDAPDGESPILTQARMTQLRAEKQNLENRLAAYQAEQSAYTRTSDLPPLQEQLAQRQANRLEQEEEAIREQIAKRRESEIQKRIREAKESVEQVPAELRPLAEENLEIAKKLDKTSQRIAQVQQQKAQIEEHRVELSSRFETTQVRVDAIGLSEALGIMLRQNKYDVNRLRNRFPVNPDLENEVSKIRAASYLSEDRAEAIQNPDDLASAFVQQLSVPKERIDPLQTKAAELLRQQRDGYQRLMELQNDSFNAIFGLLTEQKQFTNLCNEYSDYIDEHVLWIRSAPLLGASDSGDGQSDLMNLSESISELSAPSRWQRIGQSVVKGARNRLSMFLVIAGGLFLILVSRPKLISNIRSSAEIADKRACRIFTPTATTLMETILLSFWWPGVLMTVGWLLHSDFSATGLARALGTGLVSVGLLLYPFEFLRQLCRPEGLAECHFDWPDAARLCLRRNVLWLELAGTPLLLLVITLHELGIEEWNNTLGRSAALILLILTSVFIYLVMRPGSALFRDARNRDSQFYKMRHLRFVVLGLGLVTLVGLAVTGYYYTTYQLGVNLLQSVALLIGIVALYAISLRFLLVRRRRLRYDQLVTQRQEQVKQREAAQKANPEGAVPTNIAEALDIELQKEVGTDIVSVNRQAKELTNVIFLALLLIFLWRIWQDVLPATKMLDNWELWNVAVGDKGETETVTFRDVLFSAGLFLLTFFGVRNVPGMLELILLDKLPLDSGSRYAITTICRYVITVVGVILALNFLKIPWSNYGWLVAAISVGLGFGLQEIVANFASGLIILLERPVRVGDVVTIDDTWGIVTRIQMRATTITNWDNQELIVPNKDLVTGRLMNWTLSSVINRVTLEVGVAYGSDVRKVKEIIEKVADENPDVLKDPAPVVALAEFGDSSLNFKLRCCITALEKRIPIRHELNQAINEEFATAGIVIPFPQRDLHIIDQPDQSE